MNKETDDYIPNVITPDICSTCGEYKHCKDTRCPLYRFMTYVYDKLKEVEN